MKILTNLLIGIPVTLHASPTARNFAFLTLASSVHSTSFFPNIIKQKVPCDINTGSDSDL